MRGLPLLLDMRMRGVAPARPVWIDVGGEYQAPRYERDLESLTLTLAPTEQPELLDLRPLYRLAVIVHAERYTPQVARLYAALQRYAIEIFLFVTEWQPERLGYVWTQQGGQRNFGG